MNPHEQRAILKAYLHRCVGGIDEAIKRTYPTHSKRTRWMDKLVRDMAQVEKRIREIDEFLKCCEIEEVQTVATYHRQMNYDPNVEGVTV